MLNNIGVIVICHKCSDTFIKNVSTCVSVQRMLSQVNYKEFPMNEMAKTLLKISIIPGYDSDKEDIFQYVLQLAINY
ncbi:unnamed protein product, partial [Tenebrio molitor]